MLKFNSYFYNVSILSCLIIITLGLFSCRPNNPDNRYDRLSNNNQGWQDMTDEVNGGADQTGSLRTFFFLRSGDFQINCEASDPSCVTGGNTSGTWDYITNSKVQVNIYNGPILFYDIVKIDPVNLWLQDNNTRGVQVLRKFVPVR